MTLRDQVTVMTTCADVVAPLESVTGQAGGVRAVPGEGVTGAGGVYDCGLVVEVPRLVGEGAAGCGDRS